MIKSFWVKTEYFYLWDVTKELARKMGISRSELICRAIAEFCFKHES